MMEQGQWKRVQKRTPNNTSRNNLGGMQHQLRCELSDRSVRLFPSRCVGRVIIEVQEDRLSAFLNNFPKEKKDPYAWGQGKEEPQMEICAEVGCQHTEAEHHEMVQTLQNNYELLKKECADQKWDLLWSKNELERLEKDLEQAKAEAKQCPEHGLALESHNDDLEHLEKDLEQAKAEVEKLKIALTNVFQNNLQQKMDAMKAARIMELSHKAQLDASIAEIKTLQSSQMKSQDQCLHLQQERNSLVEKKDKSSKVVEAQLEARNHQINSLKTALKEAEQQFESHRFHWQEEKSSLLQKTEALSKTLLKKEQKSKDKERVLTSQLDEVQRSRASYQAQLEEQVKESKTLMAALKEAENRFESIGIDWEENKTSLLQETEVLNKTLRQKEQESEDKERVMTSQLDEVQRSRASYQAQLEEQKQEGETLMAALKEAENRFESTRIDWEENKTSLLQETELLNKTLRQKEQESEYKERVMSSELEDLKSQIQKKKSKKKWYRRLFCSKN